MFDDARKFARQIVRQKHTKIHKRFYIIRLEVEIKTRIERMSSPDRPLGRVSS